MCAHCLSDFIHASDNSGICLIYYLLICLKLFVIHYKTIMSAHACGRQTAIHTWRCVTVTYKWFFKSSMISYLAFLNLSTNSYRYALSFLVYSETIIKIFIKNVLAMSLTRSKWCHSHRFKIVKLYNREKDIEKYDWMSPSV